MTETEFLDQADTLLDALQSALDRAELDLDYQLNGGVLQIEFDDGAKMVVNRHLPNREIWVAAKSGGYHFAQNGEGQWISQRDGLELYALVSELVSRESGEPFTWRAN